MDPTRQKALNVTMLLAPIAAATLGFLLIAERRDVRDLADDLYTLCERIPEALPTIKLQVQANPMLLAEAEASPHFRAQRAYAAICTDRNGEAMYEAQERALKRARRR